MSKIADALHVGIILESGPVFEVKTGEERGIVDFQCPHTTGAWDVEFNGPIAIKGIDVPAFGLPITCS